MKTATDSRTVGRSDRRTLIEPALWALVGNTPLVPVQLIESAFDFALAAVLTIAWRRRPRPAGTVLWLYFILYGAGRATIEFWRGDAVRGLWFGGAVSTSQIFSVAAILAGGFFLIRDRVRRTRLA